MSCIICLDKNTDHVVLPCAHMCMCGDCAMLFNNNNCPICEGNIEKIIKVFIVSRHPGERMIEHRYRQYIESKRDDIVYSYYVIGAIIHRGEKQPVTHTEFDTVDFKTLTYPSLNEDFADPQLSIGYIDDSTVMAKLEDGYHDINGLPQTKIIKSIELNISNAAKFIMRLSKVYSIIDVFGNPIYF